MNLKGYLFLWVFILNGALYAKVTMVDLDRVLDKANSMEEFLASPELIEEYYQLALDYYGGSEHFPRKSFNLIIKTFRDAIKHIPELSQIAFKKNSNAATSTFKSAIHNYDVKINKLKWSLFLAQSNFKVTDASAEELLKEMESSLIWLAGQRNVLIQDKPSRAVEIINAIHMNEVKTRNEYRKLKQLLAMLAFKDPDFRKRIMSQDANVSLHAYNEFRTNYFTERFKAKREFDEYSKILRMVLNDFPNSNVLVKNNEYFIPDVQNQFSNARFDFVELPRKFHAMFSGVSLKECLGAGATEDSKLSFKRLLVGMLKGAKDVHVLYDQVYQGRILHVPVLANDKDAISIEVMAPHLDSKIAYVENGEVVDRSMVIDLYLEKEKSLLPKDILGFLVSTEEMFHNGGGFPALKKSFQWALSLPDLINSVRTKDIELEKSISSIPERTFEERNLVAYFENDKLIYQAGKVSLSSLRLIERSSGLSSLSNFGHKLNNHEFIKLGVSMYEFNLLSSLEKVAHRDWVFDTLSDIASGKRSNQFTEEFFENCSIQCVRNLVGVLLHEAQSLEQFKAILQLFHSLPSLHQRHFFNEFVRIGYSQMVRYFASLNPIEKQQAIIEINQLLNHESSELFFKNYLSSINNPKLYLKLIFQKKGNGLSKNFESFLIDQLQNFKSLNPSVEDWLNLMSLFQNKENREHFYIKFFHLNAQNFDFMKRFIKELLNESQNLTDSELRKIMKFVQVGMYFYTYEDALWILNNFPLSKQSMLEFYMFVFTGSSYKFNAEEFYTITKMLYDKLNTSSLEGTGTEMYSFVDMIAHFEKKFFYDLNPSAVLRLKFKALKVRGAKHTCFFHLNEMLNLIKTKK